MSLTALATFTSRSRQQEIFCFEASSTWRLFRIFRTGSTGSWSGTGHRLGRGSTDLPGYERHPLLIGAEVESGHPVVMMNVSRAVRRILNLARLDSYAWVF
jgi:hypothetical protein